MSANLTVVSIPGLAEAVRRESAVRRTAWTQTHATIAGVRVRFLTVGDVVRLEEIENGFFCPWRFDSDVEMLAHCAQLIWWLSDDMPKPDRGSLSLWHLRCAAHKGRLIRYLATRPVETLRETTQFLKEQYMDAPKASEETTYSAPIAASPAYVWDSLTAGGYSFALQEVLQMPLVQVWQLMRLAQRRLYGITPTNPSDKLATDYLAKMNAAAGSN